jgi:hypothetical protein
LAIPFHLPFIRLAKRDHPSLAVPIVINASEETSPAEGHLPNFAVFEAITDRRHIWPGEQNLAQRQRHAMLCTVDRVLGGAEYALHTEIYAAGV